MKSSIFIEVWKDIKDYEGLYQVSNLGRVKSLERTRNNCYNSMSKIKEHILKPSITKCGYYNVVLSKDNNKKHKLIHRLVAEAFIDNKYNKTCINHINECKWDNAVWNLEWCTHKENNNYGNHNIKLSISKTGKYNRKDVSKPVLQYTVDGQFIAEYPSMLEAQRQTGFFQTGIGQCCRGNKKYSTVGGYKWKFKQ